MSNPNQLSGQEPAPQSDYDALMQLNDQLNLHVPEGVDEAQQMVDAARQARGRIAYDAEGKPTVDGREIPANVDGSIRAFAQEGLGNFRLDSTNRGAWTEAAHAAHPSDIKGPEQQKYLKGLKNSAGMMDSNTMSSFRDTANRRLKLDEEVAKLRGEEVAPLPPNFVDQEKKNADARETALATAKAANEAHAAKVQAAQDAAAESGRKTEKKRARTEAARDKARAEALDRVADFIQDPANEHASGGEVKKGTGLSRDDMLRLGFNSFTEMKTAAAQARAQKEAAAAQAQADQEAAAAKAQAEQEAADREKAYRDAGKAQADAWNAERDAHRAAKASADERVRRIENKYKFEHGGQNELDKNPDLAAQVHADAVAQAEAEGQSVGHLRSGEGMVVPRDLAAEQRASELGALLRGQSPESGQTGAAGANADNDPATAENQGTGDDPSVAENPYRSLLGTSAVIPPLARSGRAPQPVGPNMFPTADKITEAYFRDQNGNNEALTGRLDGMQSSLERLARARKAADLGVGKRGRGETMGELDEAIKELHDAIEGQTFASEAEKTRFRMMAMRRVGELEVENSPEASRWDRALTAVGNSRIMRFIGRHRKALYVAEGALAVAAAAVTIGTGGAAAPAVAAAMAAAAAKGGFLGLLTGTAAGAAGARTGRHMANTAEATQARSETRLAELGIRDGESAQAYAQRVNDTLRAQSEAMYDDNTSARRRTIGRAALNGAIGGTVTGALSGSVHAFHIGGVHKDVSPTPSQLTPQQIHDSAQQFVDGQPHPDWSTLSNQAANSHHGQTLWHAVQGQGSEHLSNATTDHTILDGMTKLHNAGFDIHTHGAVHWDGHHYVTTGDKWSFGNNAVQTPHGGAYVVGPEGQPHLFSGALNNGQQAELLKLLSQPNTQVMGHDQFVNYLSQQVHAPAPAAPSHIVVPHTVNNNVLTTALNPESTVADVAAAAAVTVSQATPSRAATTPAPQAPPVAPEVGHPIADQLGIQEQIVNLYDQEMQQVDLDGADERVVGMAQSAQLRQVALANRDTIGRLNANAFSSLADRIVARSQLDKQTVLRILSGRA